MFLFTHSWGIHMPWNLMNPYRCIDIRSSHVRECTFHLCAMERGSPHKLTYQIWTSCTFMGLRRRIFVLPGLLGSRWCTWLIYFNTCRDLQLLGALQKQPLRWYFMIKSKHPPFISESPKRIRTFGNVRAKNCHLSTINYSSNLIYEADYKWGMCHACGPEMILSSSESSQSTFV